MKELSIAALTENIPAVTQFIDSELEAAGCSAKVQIQIDVAVDEIFGNIANYAYTPNTGMATVRVDVRREVPEVQITFIDSGMPYNPLERGDPDLTASAEEREIGGLGIFLVKKTMDAMSYEYRDGNNILTITKRI